MIRPKPKDILEIIEKLKILKEKLSDFINVKCNTSPDKADEMVHATYDEAEQLLRSLLDFDFDTASEKLLKFMGMHPKELFEDKLKELTIDELEKLLNEFIPKLIADSEILSTQKQQLHQIENSISRKLERKEKRKGDIAKRIKITKQSDLLRMQQEGDWPKDIKQLMNEIEKLLSPYLDYLKEKGTSGKWEQALIEYFIKTGKPSYLDIVTQELEKIKYKMEVEAKQKEPEKPTITGKEESTEYLAASKPTDKQTARTPRKSKRKKKTPSSSQLLIKAREDQARKLLKSNPSMTVEKLGEKLGCDKGTACRTDAWKKHQLRKKGQKRKIPNGFKRNRSGDGPDTEAIANEPQAEHFDIKEMFEDYNTRKSDVIPTTQAIAAKLSIKETEAEKLFREAQHFFEDMAINTSN